MYINKIEELLDKIINNFYFSVIKTNKELKPILEEKNFVKYQKKINTILEKFISSEISLDEIKKIIQNEDHVVTVFNVLSKYVCYYFFIFIGLNYKGKHETFINNVVEFSKNQPSFGLRVPGYFSSESSAQTVKYVNMINRSITILGSDQKKQEKLSKDENYQEAFKFLYGLGPEIIKTIKLENIGNKSNQQHNIIKIIIVIEMYINIDKKDIYLILDASSKEEGEYIFIDIVVPKTDFIDYNTIETVLSKSDIDSGHAYEIYEQLKEYDQLGEADLSIQEKIQEIINRRFLIPITEDFLLYHKDTERYEKPGRIQTKKKDDTKIRYIVTKVDHAADLYSKAIMKDQKLKEIIEKAFYQPLAHRNVVLFNNIEEIHIINKLLNQGRTAIENNEYYNDIVNLRKYPFHNFKDFSKDGFYYKGTKTVDAVRLTSIKKSTSQLRHNLEMRVGSNDMLMNIVGFIIPTNEQDIRCLQRKDLVDIRRLQFKTGSGKKKTLANGLTATTKFFKHSVLKGKKYKPSIYWLLDIEKDEVQLDKYIQVKKMDKQQNSQLIIASFYDKIAQASIDKLYKIIDSKKSLSFYDFYKAVDFIRDKYVNISEKSPIYKQIDKYVTFEKSIKTEKVYDKRQDKFPGLYGEIIELPKFKEGKKGRHKTVKIHIDQDVEKPKEEVVELEKIDAICQHHATLDSINAIRKKNPNDFSKLLVEFVYQYVYETIDGDYICKSCSTLLPIKKYVSDGSYDGEGRFTTLATPMQVPLEDIPEYEKYKPSIRSIDKLVDRLASITNMNFLTGKSFRMKNDVRIRVVKDVVDTVLIHNKNLKTYFKERTAQMESYGISKNLTNLFVFELDNNIFVYSSKDKDYYKPIKRNNILVYSLFYSLLELTDTHALLMGGDRICNYLLFAKVGYNLFENINIIINNKGMKAPIQKYKVLCYLIFYTTCMITKYGMWQTDVEGKTAKKFNPQIQKTIIHTFVDFLNSFLQINATKQNLNHMYNIVSTKFFLRLNTIFSNKDTLEKIKNIQKARMSKISERRKSEEVVIKSIPLPEKYSSGTYSGDSDWRKCKGALYHIPTNTEKKQKFYRVNNITNCEDGEFHKWVVKGNNLVCEYCEKSVDKIKISSEISNKISENLKYKNLSKLTEKYCKTGELHDFVFDTKKDCNVCRKCKVMDTSKMSRKEINKLASVVYDIEKKKERRSIASKERYQKGLEEKQQKSENIIKDLKSKYGKTKQHKEDFYNHVDNLIKYMESVIGKNTNIGNKDIYLRHDTYIIDHDHNGYKAVKKFTIADKDDKIKFKKNHPFFKTDVLYYTNNKLQIDVFYNSTTLLLLGYKEKNKEFEKSKVRNVFLKVNYSILNRLRLMGYRNKYIDIQKMKDEIFDKYAKKDSQFILKQIVSEIARLRIDNLKKMLNYTQMILYRIRYGYEKELTPDLEKTEYEMQNLVDKYKALKVMIIKDSKTGNRVFQDWKAISFGLNFQDTGDKTINISLEDKYVLSEEISNYDYHGNLLLFYIVKNMANLISYNTNKFIKTNTAYLLIDTIIRMHTRFNREDWKKNFSMKRFGYIMRSIASKKDIEGDEGTLEDITTGIYGEYVDTDDELDPETGEAMVDDREEMDAIDVDTEVDYQIDYMAGVNTG